MGIHEKLLTIQNKLKAPKSQYNSFGKYNYRNCEDILEAAKPLLTETNCTLFISDSVQMIGSRYYIETTVTIIDIETKENVSVKAYAREEESKKGMDGSQVSGASSSYARKYALNGLLLIDDTKDSDTTNASQAMSNTKNSDTTNASQAMSNNEDVISEAQAKRMYAISKGNADLCKNILQKYGYKKSVNVKKLDYEKICSEIESQVY